MKENGDEESHETPKLALGPGFRLGSIPARHLIFQANPVCYGFVGHE